MNYTKDIMEELTSQYNKFKFHRTILILCGLYFGYTYVVDFTTGSIIYRILMGGILIAIASLALYSHKKMRELQRRIQKENKDI